MYNGRMSTWREAVARQIDVKAIIATTLSYFFVPRWLTYKLLGASKYMVHKTRTRDNATRQLKLAVLNHYDWTCEACLTRNYRNREPDKAKMQVDHINPVYRWGESNWDNLQVLCKPCNLKKGTKVIDYRGTPVKRYWRF